jgi:hypothetical protein
VAPAEQTAAREATLARPAQYAFETLTHYLVVPPRVRDAPRVLPHWLLMRHDTAAMREAIEARVRRRDRVSVVNAVSNTLDDAQLLVAIGDSADARRTLELLVSALPYWPTRTLASPYGTSEFVRAAVLLAGLHRGVGDRVGERRAASAATALWSDADPFLRARVILSPRGDPHHE